MPASRSMVPGDPSPTAAMRSQSSPAASTALFPAATRLSTPTTGPWSAWVARLIEESGRPCVIDHAALDVRPAQVDAEEIGRRGFAGIHQSAPGDVALAAVNQGSLNQNTIYGFGWDRSTARERARTDVMLVLRA